MGCKYAGVLGPIAFATLVARGVMDGASAESTLKVACLSLFAFAAMGYVVGTIASATVRDSARFTLETRMKAHKIDRQAAGEAESE